MELSEKSNPDKDTAEWSATSSVFDKSNSIHDSPINSKTLKECLADPEDTQGPDEDTPEWSATSSVFDKSNSIHDSPINSKTLKECLADPKDTQGIEDYMVVDTSVDNNITNFNADDTKYISTSKPTTFQRKHRLCTNNDSVMFENILNEDSLMEVTNNSVCFSRFYKRAKLLTPNNDFVEINKSDNSGIDSVNEMSIKPPKFQFSKNNDRSCFNLTNYSLSSSDVSEATDQPNVLEVTGNAVFKKPFDSSVLENDSSNVTNVSNTKVITHKFTKKNVEVIDTVFDNIINDSSVTSDVSSSKNKSLTDNSPVNTQEFSKCSTLLDRQSFNHTYDIPVSCNDFQIRLSKSVTNNCELNNISLAPVNETYTLKNGSISDNSNCNMSLDIDNAKDTFSDTYVIENNANDTVSAQNTNSKSVNRSKTEKKLVDEFCIYNQSKSSECKPNFKRKLQLTDEIQNFTLTHDDTDIDEIYEIDSNESDKFKSKKTYHEADSKIFDNIITSQKTDMSISECINHSRNNLSNSLMTSTNNLNDLSNFSSQSKSMIDIGITTDKSFVTQQSNSILDKEMENGPNMSKSLLFKSNEPNSGCRVSNKFNFFRQYGRQSLSFQEKSKSPVEIKKQSVSFSIANNIAPEKLSHSSLTPDSNFNINGETCSKMFSIPEKDTDSNTLKKNVSPLLNNSNHKVESNQQGTTLSQNTTFQPSQSPKLHFTGPCDLNAHSGVFSGLIDDSLKSDGSLNISNQTKNRFPKNVSEEADSMMFENVIVTNTQESDTTLITNNMSNYSIKSQKNLAYFNNDHDVVDETYFSKSSRSPIHSDNESVKNNTLYNQNNGSLSNTADLNNEDNDNETNDEIFWITDESSVQKSNTFKSNRVDSYHTPRTNKLAERIADTIGIMSENRKKVTHPGAFQLINPTDNVPVTRSVTQQPSATQSPSILTRAFAVNSTTDCSMSLSQSFSGIIVDQPQVEETIKEKFIRLYNKESWITKHLYDFLVSKLKPTYNIYALKHAEKFVKYLASVLNLAYDDKTDFQMYSDLLKFHMARYKIIETTFDYVVFLTDYIPRPYYDKFVPGYLETSTVKFDHMKSYMPIMEDQEFLKEVLVWLNK